MLVPIERLLQRRSRYLELVALRARLKTERASAYGEDQAAALHIRSLKLRLAATAGRVSSCGGCAAGKPWPRGAYAGGDCCSGVTEHLFADTEVAALAQAGTRPRDLTAPRGDHPGCAFRGSAGCTLEVAHRPTVCVRYACDGLLRELHQLGRLDEVEALSAELLQALQQFETRLAERRDRALVDEIAAAFERSIT